jgi:hypothetical protein
MYTLDDLHEGGLNTPMLSDEHKLASLGRA